MFEDIVRYGAKWETLGNPIDLYYPNPQSLLHRNRPIFPIAVLLPGFGVERIYYSHYARQIARYGFVVVVPDGITAIRSRIELFDKLERVPEALAAISVDLPEAGKALVDLLDLGKLVLLGHSHGGAIGLDAIRGARNFPPTGDYRIPEVLVGAVFFGTFLWEDSHNLPIDRSRIPIASIAGSSDSLIPPREILETYERIQNSPKAYIMVKGANHYGITNRNNPPGAPPEPRKPTIEQAVAIETIARWSALFLRAYALGDRMACQLYQRGIKLDPNVEVLTTPSCQAAMQAEDF